MQVPTLFADSAFHIGYHLIASVDAIGPGKMEGNDFYDLQVLADSVYADLVVTDDRRLHRIAEHSPCVDVRLRRFDEWARVLARER